MAVIQNSLNSPGLINRPGQGRSALSMPTNYHKGGTQLRRGDHDELFELIRTPSSSREARSLINRPVTVRTIQRFWRPLATTRPVSPGTRTPWHHARAGDAGWATLRSSPISARTGSSAADNTRSLSSYPVAGTSLKGGSPGSLVPPSIASQHAESPRHSLLLLKPLPLQQQRIRKRLIVVRTPKHQLLQFLRRSCQQQRIIRLYVRGIDAIFLNLRLQ